jgi:molybdopterin converting factor small subunit
MSELWKNERYFSTFEEADTLRKSLLSGPNGATLQAKVKRCGEGGTQYVVKSRTNPELKAAIQEVEEQLLVAKDKKTKKSKK